MGLTYEQKSVVRGLAPYIGDASMLNDIHMSEFNEILKSYSFFNMQSPLLIQKPCNIQPVAIDNEYIQLLFSGNSEKGHWICMYYNNKTIHIYDSLNARCLQNEHKIFINRLFPNNSDLKITFETVQSQNNTYDCGIFAIAFVVSILFNICPCSLSFDIFQMRPHLLKIFETRNIEMFPIQQNYAYEIVSHNYSEMPIRRNVFHKFSFTSEQLILNDEDINLIEKNYQKQLMLEQKKIINLYNNKTHIDIIEPIDIDMTTTFENLHITKTATNFGNPHFNKVHLKEEFELKKKCM